VLFLINYFITDKVVFDNVFEATVIPKQSQLNDMIAKLFPLHALVTINIHFFEKINQGQSKLHFELVIASIVIQMLEHY